jgi:hypothetical protein
MYFPESESIVREHPDLQRVARLVDERMCEIFSTAPLRPPDFACVIGADVNQVTSVFELLVQKGLLQRNEVVECARCHTLMPAVDYRQAVDDEDECECSNCGRPFHKRSTSINVYRMTARAASRPKPKGPDVDRSATSIEEPLSDRAQLVLVAMHELGAIDSDTRRSTEVIAARAIGANADANSLKSVMSDLKTRQLIETKTGRGGGCWLAKNGQSRAKKLRRP